MVRIKGLSRLLGTSKDSNNIRVQGIALPGPRAPLYLLSEKDATPPANSAIRLTRFAAFALASLLTPLTSAQQEPTCRLCGPQAKFAALNPLPLHSLRSISRTGGRPALALYKSLEITLVVKAIPAKLITNFVLWTRISKPVL
jgi:hypothetical protein